MAWPRTGHGTDTGTGTGTTWKNKNNMAWMFCTRPLARALSAVDARRVRSASSRTRTVCAIYSVSFSLSPPSSSHHSRRVYGGNLAFEIRKVRTHVLRRQVGLSVPSHSKSYKVRNCLPTCPTATLVAWRIGISSSRKYASDHAVVKVIDFW